MAQKREKDDAVDLQVPVESTLSLSTTTATATTSGCGSVGSGHGPDPTRLDRQARSGGDLTGPVCMTEERKRAAEEPGSGEESAKPAKRSVNRCSGCRKRVGLTGFRCRCGDLFCSEHRYSDRHECSYDYKAAGRAAIARENPVVRAAKILKV